MIFCSGLVGLFFCGDEESVLLIKLVKLGEYLILFSGFLMIMGIVMLFILKLFFWLFVLVVILGLI